MNNNRFWLKWQRARLQHAWIRLTKVNIYFIQISVGTTPHFCIRPFCFSSSSQSNISDTHKQFQASRSAFNPVPSSYAVICVSSISWRHRWTVTKAVFTCKRLFSFGCLRWFADLPETNLPYKWNIFVNVIRNLAFTWHEVVLWSKNMFLYMCIGNDLKMLLNQAMTWIPDLTCFKNLNLPKRSREISSMSRKSNRRHRPEREMILLPMFPFAFIFRQTGVYMWNAFHAMVTAVLRCASARGGTDVNEKAAQRKCNNGMRRNCSSCARRNQKSIQHRLP